MSCYSNQEQEMPFINHPSSPSVEEDGEEELLLPQETTAVDSPSPSATNCFSLLNLHAFPPPSSSSSASAHSHLHCTHCGYDCVGVGVSPVSSHKRPSPEPSSSAHDCEQPKHKKPNNPPSFHGFSKIPLPTQDQPLLRRCSSVPPNVVTNTATQVLLDPPQSPPPQNVDIARPETPLSTVRASAAKLPPRAPTLMRSVSDPNPSPSKTFSNSCGTMGGYESPNDKRLRRMRDCIRKMNKWWDEILPEEEDAGTALINNNNNNGATMENSEADIEESVSVERAGECLIIHFKCPCGKGYQILLSGRNCYYKLM
ncbi:hypothetical protein LWI29_014556 [Acer saccharum]|uniref:Uncharacterized protein n=1 Tax=Acer saccharum TaxID=4024 RepID=A0AA39SI15_ACESA|nr:hypothetical protein LWI29_014556 [Acer saccharum]